ncbi:hypothetical protein E2986_00312 [Frieseomelitta varia]|uniref:Uncharacterized protein n=1 Tax=Frieseomelitta varia TaxID=561572 RepID=A0A833W4S5_9HYME|nr:hypothetical protein E2986_00312 [Frieseomelitta varia]
MSIVRVAWKENRQRNEKNDEELGQVEVVARQIPRRSRSTNRGRSRGFVGTEKPTILYSRLELAERLRLAWKYREKNKANINIFLARETVDERCESEMSNHTNASSPVRKKDKSKIEISLDDYKMQNEKEEREMEKIIIDKSMEDLSKNNSITSRNSEHKFLHFSSDDKQVLEENEVSADIQNKAREKADVEREQSNEQISKDASIDDTNAKKKSSASIDCSSYRVTSTTLPSIKIENSTLGVMKVSKEDFSSAKQKRASFHSGTNRAFLDPIRSPTEFRWNSTPDKNVPQKSSINNRATVERSHSIRLTTVENKETVTNERAVTEENVPEFRCDLTDGKSIMKKMVADGKLSCVSEKNERMKTVVESKNTAAEDKTMTQKTNEADEFNLIEKTLSTSTVAGNKGSFTIDKATCSKNSSEVRCSSVNERDPPLKKTAENQKIDQKSRRTSSAPPQRRFESTSANNRVHVNIVIDSSGKNKNQGKQDANCKDNAMEKADITSTKISSNRAVRSAPLKRRSRSARRRFCGGGSSKNDEVGKSGNRSAGRAKNSIDSRTMDIVTMVSLVSSTDSDTDTENSPRDDKLIDELRSKLPTTSIIKTSINSALSSARKPIKSVSFQKDSFDENTSPKEQQPLSREEKKTIQPWLAIVNQRGNGATSSNEETVSWRTDITNSSALPILALIHDAEEPLDVPLTDREKRCLAVPIGDLHDKKRKLLKTRSTPSRSGMDKQTTSLKIKMQDSPRTISQKMEVPAQQTKTPINNSPANIKSAFTPSSKETFQHVQSISTEPHFQTNKEKECWHLYKKMCDKGVCVSFDTVLRGMLTPTEYRLRQREVSQNLQ